MTGLLIQSSHQALLAPGLLCGHHHAQLTAPQPSHDCKHTPTDAATAAPDGVPTTLLAPPCALPTSYMPPSATATIVHMARQLLALLLLVTMTVHP